MKRLILIACVMLAGCEAEVHVNDGPIPTDIRHVAGGAVSEFDVYEIRHRGKVYLICRRFQAITKLDEWPDTQPKEARP